MNNYYAQDIRMTDAVINMKTFNCGFEFQNPAYADTSRYRPNNLT